MTESVLDRDKVVTAYQRLLECASATMAGAMASDLRAENVYDGLTVDERTALNEHYEAFVEALEPSEDSPADVA